MWKPVVVATAAFAIAGSSIVYAQQHFGEGDRDGPRFEHRHRLSPEDRAAFVEARIAALKAGLELTPDQAKNWPAFEQALREMAQLRAERRAAREAAEQNPSQTPSAPFDRLAKRADNMAKASAALKRIAEAGQPLYTSLNDAQKGRFEKLAWMLRPHHHWRVHYLEGPDGHGWREGHGGDGPMWGHHWRHFGEDDGAPGGMHRMMDQEQGSEL
ncbi:MAG: Spy/CpxP family protein refolding chaperone [Xanthobacteraceae bacterium]